MIGGGSSCGVYEDSDEIDVDYCNCLRMEIRLSVVERLSQDDLDGSDLCLGGTTRDHRGVSKLEEFKVKLPHKIPTDHEIDRVGWQAT